MTRYGGYGANHVKQIRPEKFERVIRDVVFRQEDGQYALADIPDKDPDGHLEAGHSPDVGSADIARTVLSNITNTCQPCDDQANRNRAQKVGDYNRQSR